jgi:glycine hydroxymethyltransferase
VTKGNYINNFSALTPNGIRIGTPAVTTRGMKEDDMNKIADFIDRVIKLCITVQEKSGKAIKDFITAIELNEELKAIKKEVEEFSIKFSLPGIDINQFKQ